MKTLKVIFTVMIALPIVTSTASAGGDFAWMRDFNVRAEADPTGFRARLEARFQVGAAMVETVLDSTEKPADAYMLLRFGEMSRQPLKHVIDTYAEERGQGWGSLARRLGIKPGSREFHALKQGHDLYDGKDKSSGKGKSKDKKKK